MTLGVEDDLKKITKMVNKDKLFDPSCCSYRLNKKFRAHVNQMTKDDNVDELTKSKLDELKNQKLLSYSSLEELHKYLQRADPEYCDPFYKLIEACRCIKPRSRENKQLEERLKMLRLRSSQKMYSAMTSSVDKRSGETLVEGSGQVPNELRVLSGSMMALLNSFLVYICTFIFCYKAVEYALPEENITAQVIFGILGSTVVALAEIYFLTRVI